MAEIEAHAEKAKDAALGRGDVTALATALAARYPHRDIEEVKQAIIDYWRSKGLFYTGE